MNYEVNTQANYNGETVTILKINKGWITVQISDDETKQLRANALSPVGERTMKDQLAKARKKYVKTKTYGGEASADCGDPVAQLLRGMEPIHVCSLADKLYEEEIGFHETKYSHLNPGQVRMCSGNRIRGGVKREMFTPEDVSAAHEELGL